MGAAQSLSPEVQKQVTLPSKQAKSLIKWFKKVADKEKKTITARQFEGVFMGLDYSIRESLGDNSQLLFDKLDSNHDGTLDLEEILIGLSVMAQGTLEDKAKLTFKAMDLDSNGSLDKSEVKLMFKKFSQTSIEILNYEVKLAMYESTGKFLKPEIVEPYVKQQVKPLLDMLAGDGAIDTLLNMGDKDKSSTISMDEWVELVKTNELAKYLVSPQLWTDKIKDSVVRWCQQNIDVYI